MADTSMNVIWSPFDLDRALEDGVVVGFQPNEEYGISTLYTGKLTKEPKINTEDKYKAIINGLTMYFDKYGNCIESPINTYIGLQLHIVQVAMTFTKGTATTKAVTRSGGEGEEDVTVLEDYSLTSLDPRDQFALSALRGLISSIDNPQDMDDANILGVCKKAYRWAQGMMQAAADARKEAEQASGGGDEPGGGDSGSSGGTTRGAVDVTDGTTSEKLLNNLVAAVDDLTAVQKKMLVTTGEGESQKTFLNMPDLNLKQPVKIDNADGAEEPKEFKVSGGGGGSLNRDDVNDAGETITDVVVYNTAVGKAPLRATIANFAAKVLSTLGLNWLKKKVDGETVTNITSASTFFSTYKAEMKAVLDSEYDSKGSAAQALADAKQYADDNFERKTT